VPLDLSPNGTLRAAINLGNPVLARGGADDPRGITVDLARELAARLGVPVALSCSTAARDSLAALVDGRVDIGFLAVEPAREEELTFTSPYLLTDGVYVVPEGSAVCAPADVDRPGTRVGVKLGSAYDLFLSRTLERAQIIRGDEGVDTFLGHGLEVGAGIRPPTTAWVAEHPGHRLVEPAFMQIRQAVAVRRDRSPEVVDWLRATVAELVASGWVEARVDQ